MSIFSKTAFIATLALGALIGLNEIQITGVNSRELMNFAYQQASQTVRTALHTTATKSLYRAVDSSFEVTFEPDPNEPPTTTGGSGTR